MKIRIFSQNNGLYLIPFVLILLRAVLIFFGVRSLILINVLFIVSFFAVLGYNLIPVRITLDEKELRINHIFPRKIGIDSIDRVRLEEYSAHFKGYREKRVRLKIVYRRKDETMELFLNDSRIKNKLFVRQTARSSSLYDLRNCLNSYLSERKSAIRSGK